MVKNTLTQKPVGRGMGFIKGFVLGVGGVKVLFLSMDVRASDGEAIVKVRCIVCHRIVGQPVARSKKKDSDLIWAGSKYQRPWLVAWLQHPKEKLYPLGYDFNFTRKGPHLSLNAVEAEQVADFLEGLKDHPVTEGLMKPGTPAKLPVLRW